MQRLGWVEGRNLTVERRVTGEDPERRKIAAAELIAANPDVIVAAGPIDALPAHAQTRTIAIVVIAGNDLVERGLANSLARPGGNVTRIVVFGGELGGKRLIARTRAGGDADLGPVFCRRPEKHSPRERHRGPSAPARHASYCETSE